MRSGAAKRINRRGWRSGSGGCCGRRDAEGGRLCGGGDLRRRALRSGCIGWVRQLWWGRSGAAASRAQNEDEEEEMTDSVAALMALASQDSSPNVQTWPGESN